MLFIGFIMAWFAIIVLLGNYIGGLPYIRYIIEYLDKASK